MGGDAPPAPDLHTDRAHSARMYDYFLGGKTNYAVDRDAAEAALVAMPAAAVGARRNRAFMHRAARFVAGQGIDQFLDVGTGIPTEPNLHQVAQAIHPAARLVYIDNDPIVLAHAAALMTSTPEGAITYIHADARDPASILEAPALRATLDLTRPVGISIVALLHFIDDDHAVALIRALLDVAAPGSWLTLSHTSLDGDTDGSIARFVETYRARGIPVFPRGRRQLEELFLHGLEIAEPGIVFTPQWRPDADSRAADTDDAGMTALLAAVARTT